MNVESLMTKDVKFCTPEQTLAQAAQLMWEHDCGAIPIIDGISFVIGMITDRDICMAARFKGRPLSEIAIRDAMAGIVRSCCVGDTIRKAEAMMQRAQVRRLPVTDPAGRLVGVLSLNDIARQAARETSAASPEITLDDVALTLGAVCLPHRMRPPRGWPY